MTVSEPRVYRSVAGRIVRVRHFASEGSVSGDGFDSGTRAFDRSNRLQQWTKVVRLTAPATDRPDKTGSADSARVKAAASLDRLRALNAAAVLSAGAGIRAQLVLSRIEVNRAGQDQDPSAKPLLGGASTEVKERGGQAAKPSDQRAQLRRVGARIVPGGAAMPSGATGPRDIPASDVKKPGCPR